jgi:hypothetical protein
MSQHVLKVFKAEKMAFLGNSDFLSGSLSVATIAVATQ